MPLSQIRELVSFAGKAAFARGMASGLAAAEEIGQRFLGPGFDRNIGALCIESIREMLGEEGAWGAALMGRLALDQFRAAQDTVAFARDIRTDVANRLDPLVVKHLLSAEHPGAALASRLVRVARAAHKAWRESRPEVKVKSPRPTMNGHAN